MEVARCTLASTFGRCAPASSATQHTEHTVKSVGRRGKLQLWIVHLPSEAYAQETQCSLVTAFHYFVVRAPGLLDPMRPPAPLSVTRALVYWFHVPRFTLNPILGAPYPSTPGRRPPRPQKAAVAG